MTTYSFPGTPGDAYTAPGSITVYGSPMLYNAAGNGLFTSGDYSLSQWVRNAVIASAKTYRILLKKTATDADDESGFVAINVSRTGFAVLVYGTNLVIRTEIGGSAGSTLTTATIPEVIGNSVLDIFYGPETGEIIVWYEGEEVATTAYADIGGLRPGWQSYKAGTVERFSLVEFNDDYIIGGTIVDFADVVRPGGTYPLETEGMDESSSATLGSKTLALSDSNVIVPSWLSGEIDDLDVGQDYTFTVTDVNDLTATKTCTYDSPEGLVHRSVPEDASTTNTSLYRIEELAPGTDVWLPEAFSDYVQENGEIIDLPFGTYTGFWRRDLTNTMYSFDLVFSETGVIEIPSRFLSGGFLRGKLL